MVVESLAAAMDHQQDIRVVGGATTAAEGLRLATELRPRVTVLGCRLPDGDGVETAKQLHRLAPEISVVMLSSGSEEAPLAQAIDAGCSAFVAKSGSIYELLGAVRAAGHGYAFFPPDMASRLAKVTKSKSPGLDLTARELEVLRLLATGQKTSAIADTLTLSHHTVRNHVRNLLSKLGAHSKLEAVVIAAGKGIVEMPGQRH
jgi:DNA-binding NarL/FixJ family response regulator